MKINTNIWKTFFWGASLLCVSACQSDYLDVDPIDRYVYYNFPQNESQVEQAVVACYRKVFPIVNSHSWVWGEFLSDNTSFRYNPGDRGGFALEQIDEFVATGDNTNFNGYYQESFEGIGRSNYVLQNLAAIPFANPATKEVREAEVRFFRAWHYFNLVRTYGDVPIITEVITEPDANVATKYPRRPVAEVYQQIILPDAEYAATKLPKTTTAAERGRLTQGAALMLLAEVKMTLRRFNDAAANLQTLLTLGYSLNANYADCFDPTKKNNAESIYEIQADPALGYSFGFMSQWTPWGTGTTIWPGGANSRGGLNQPTNDLNNAYEANDRRKAVTIGSTGTGASTILFMRKFLYWDAANRANPVNFPVYRYADALLMLAECLNEAGFPNAQAFSLLNQVRTRAGLPAKTQNNPVAVLAVNSQADFRLAIEQERRVELAGENHRWYDLVRTNRAEAVMKAHGENEKRTKTTVDRNAYNQIRVIQAIPLREVQQFGYPQNQGW
ncbi:MAG: RagB/SusD family nutrient uptake outer membrane protein [Runella sp.]